MEKQIGFSYKNLIEKCIFPLILLIWPLINVNVGVNLLDSAYSLGNYMFFEEMTGSWKYATYISNLVGYIFNELFNGRLLYMNIATGLIVSITMLSVYYGMKNEISTAILFLSGIVAESLCWCPTVILYNYLTYMLLTIATIILYKAISNNNKLYYYLAGLVLGINLFVRISNAVEVLLIAAVWVGIALYKSKGKKAKWIKQTLLCIAGYVTGAVFVVLLITVISGVDGVIAAFSWAISLFSSEGEAGGYSAGGMFGTIIRNYVTFAKWFAFMAVGIMAGIAGFSVLKDKLILLKKIGFTACAILMFIWFNRNGVFNLYYRNTSAVFGLSVIFILCQFVVLFYTIFNVDSDRKEKLLAYISITILLITPLGSNNHLFTIINNMFFIMPVSVWLFIQMVRPVAKEALYFPVISMLSLLGLILFVQSVLFHMEYSFKDGEDGAARNVVVEENCVYKGMYTNAETASIISECIELKNVEEINAAEKLVLYGDIPGLSYLLEKPSALSSSWADLESYGEKTLAEDIEKLKADNEEIILILSKDIQYDREDAKLQMILEYSKEYEYVIDSGKFIAFY